MGPKTSLQILFVVILAVAVSAQRGLRRPQGGNEGTRGNRVGPRFDGPAGQQGLAGRRPGGQTLGRQFGIWGRDESNMQVKEAEDGPTENALRPAHNESSEEDEEDGRGPFGGRHPFGRRNDSDGEPPMAFGRWRPFGRHNDSDGNRTHHGHRQGGRFGPGRRHGRRNGTDDSDSDEEEVMGMRPFRFNPSGRRHDGGRFPEGRRPQGGARGGRPRGGRPTGRRPGRHGDEEEGVEPTEGSQPTAAVPFEP